MPEWINADERLPEDDRQVLCWYQNTEGDYFPVVGRYDRHENRRIPPSWETDIDGSAFYYQPVKVTHWMPPPPPPQAIYTPDQEDPHQCIPESTERRHPATEPAWCRP